MKNIAKNFCFALIGILALNVITQTTWAENVDDPTNNKPVIQPQNAKASPSIQMVELIKKSTETKKREEKSVEILTASQAHQRKIAHPSKNITHEAIKLTPDKSEIIKLDRPAATVIVGNPNHVSVLAESSNTLILVAKAPGATHFAALDNQGNVIMARHIIVASPQKKYIRIRRSCATTENCQPTQVYYCPDMCHEIILDTAKTTTDSASATEDATSDLAAATSGDEVDIDK